ncbi:Ribosomal protein S12 methylthiotransferase accessory factor YcaO [Vibrio stylophorae]|uniref:Ribosomal protein S12 methylthiotransferase accessory factor YcaO n=1 Tax=Vibrio stylophorae TaxID=659351 RepID=A0ABM8ZUH1_9VIBR|nr:30S ribosomal protein S12 methylthiotransferase accessory factor YcaO [Vibrio stylophorae]CAH0533954.1 Ribosomal protein S12 methylthiotransferase accessory factor YcaO [Vibrio stylophorae]
MKTYIPGKDAALEESIAYFEQQLAKFGFDLEYTHWLNPIPHVWSVHIRDKDCPINFTNGKGGCKKAALASALGEYFERLSCNYFYADYYLGKAISQAPFVHYPDEKWFTIDQDDLLPAEILDERLLDFYDNQQELMASDLVDLQSGNAERGICTLPFVRQSDGQTVYIPVNIIGNLYVSNGMSAGNTKTEARTQALSEIFERAVKNRILREAIRLPQIPADVIAQYPHIEEAIATLEQEGFPIYAFDASLGGQYPVTCVVLKNPNNGTCFASFGAHPRFEVALERTVTELLQGRSLKDLDVFVEPSFDNESVGDHHNLETHFIDSSGEIHWDLFATESDYAFNPWNFDGTSAQEFDRLVAQLIAEGTDVYIADYDHLGVACCRIIVPGWSEIYPAEELVLANNNRMAHLRETLLALPQSELEGDEYGDIYHAIEQCGVDDGNLLYELLGIACAAGDPWRTLRVGELKGLLALAGGDLELAQEHVSWCINYNASTFTAERMRFYRCLAQSLQLAQSERDPAQYRDAFVRLYGEETVDAAWQSISGDRIFHGLRHDDETLANFAVHQALLASYDKLQQAKQQ